MPQSKNDTMTMAIMTDLQHGGDASATSDHGNVLTHVGLVRELGERSLHLQRLADLHSGARQAVGVYEHQQHSLANRDVLRNMTAHLASRIVLDDEIKVA